MAKGKNKMEAAMGSAAKSGKNAPANSFIKNAGKAKGGDKNPLLKMESKPIKKRK